MGQERDVFRTVSVRFSAQHCSKLEKALDAWEKLRLARGTPLFVGGHLTNSYTPERAEQQWQRLREAFIDLQTQEGRRDGQWIRRFDVQARLASFEASYRSKFVRKVAFFRQQHEKAASRTDPQVVLLSRFQRVLKAWERRSGDDKQQQRRTKSRVQAETHQ